MSIALRKWEDSRIWVPQVRKEPGGEGTNSTQGYLMRVVRESTESGDLKTASLLIRIRKAQCDPRSFRLRIERLARKEKQEQGSTDERNEMNGEALLEEIVTESGCNPGNLGEKRSS